MSRNTARKPRRFQHERKGLHEIARRRRQHTTPTERLLWDALRDGRMLGLNWRRQHVLTPHIVDFYCAKLRLAVEIRPQKWSQKWIDRSLEVRHGVRTLRITEEELLQGGARAELRRLCERRLRWLSY